MKINIFIIFDELASFDAELVVPEEQELDLNLNAASLFPSKPINICPNYLYIADAELLNKAGIAQTEAFVLCTQDVSREMLEQFGLRGIVVHDIQSVDQLSACAQGIFQKYQQWDIDVMLAIIQGETLQDIFERCAAVLKNPIGLFDNASAFVMKAGEFKKDIKDTIWEVVIANGHSKLEEFSDRERVELYSKIRTESKPFLYRMRGRDNSYLKNMSLQSPLYLDGAPYACLAMIDLNEPFSKGEVSLVYHVKTLMELALSHSREIILCKEESLYYVEQLIKGFTYDESVVKYHLGKRKWNTHDVFRLIIIYRRDNQLIDSGLYDSCSYRIKNVVSDAIIIAYENRLIAILHDPSGQNKWERLVDDMSRYLISYNLCAAVSEDFENFLLLNLAFCQAKATAEVQMKIAGKEQPFFFFNEHYFEVVAEELRKATNIKCMIHPQILHMVKSASRMDWENIHTMRIYLLCGCNASLAAEKLFIHRNTLNYRLKRIQESLNIDLNSLSENNLIYMLISLYLTEYV